MQQKYAAHALVLLLGLCFAGCSGGPEENPNWPERFPTSGTVLYQGKPVEDAEVTFTDKAGTSTGVGKTDSSGQFYLTTHIEKDGVVAGPQIVSIRRVEVIDKTPKNVDVSAGGVALPPEIKWIVPEKYSIPAQSGLTAEVTESGPNVFKFDLK